MSAPGSDLHAVSQGDLLVRVPSRPDDLIALADRPGGSRRNFDDRIRARVVLRPRPADPVDQVRFVNPWRNALLPDSQDQRELARLCCLPQPEYAPQPAPEHSNVRPKKGESLAEVLRNRTHLDAHKITDKLFQMALVDDRFDTLQEILNRSMVKPTVVLERSRDERELARTHIGLHVAELMQRRTDPAGPVLTDGRDHGSV